MCYQSKKINVRMPAMKMPTMTKAEIEDRNSNWVNQYLLEQADKETAIQVKASQSLMAKIYQSLEVQ